MAPEDEIPRSESIQYVTGEIWINNSRENEELGPQDWKRSVFIPVLKKDNTKECSNYHTIVLISHASRGFPSGSAVKNLPAMWEMQETRV